MLLEQFKHALRSMPFSCVEQGLINASPENQSYLVAYSGGMDSHVLLHLCVNEKLNVRAVYINHGLQQEAHDWQQHCRVTCKRLNVTFDAITVDATPKNGESPEEAARNARYLALKQHIANNEILLTAHHQNDQAETLLLQLMRGAGSAGLASMPVSKVLGGNMHCRPMLTISRQEIHQYAIQNKLDWIEDPSNKDTSFDRNFIRQNVMPLLQQRWRHVNESIKKSADIQQENLALLSALAQIDLANIVTQDANVISIKRLMLLSKERQFNVLKDWVNRVYLDKATRNVLMQIQSTILTASEDASPLVAWGKTEIRRFKDALYVMPALIPHDETSVIVWDSEHALDIKSLALTISISQKVTNGLSAAYLNKPFTIRFRQGGEKIKPIGQSHTSSLKNLMQQKEIPPWCRSRVPLLYIDDKLACVCGYWVADSFADTKGGGWLPVVGIRG